MLKISNYEQIINLASHKISKYERLYISRARMYRTQLISSTATTSHKVQTTPIGARGLSPSDHSQVQAVSSRTFA